MSDIRYVCLSDLHFGAANSVLTRLEGPRATPDTVHPSPVLEALVECLGRLVDANAGGRRPTLVLCGDVLEMALSGAHVAAMVFDQFLAATMAPDRRLFDDTILFVPGNHDHHLWEVAREHDYAEYVRTLPADHPIDAQWHATPAFFDDGPPGIPDRLLNSLVQRRPELAGVNVRAVYPNLGLRSAEGRRIVLFHHGHFVEPLYLLVSALKRLAFPGDRPAARIEDWEAENFAWIDFFWSTLGQSGAAGRDVSLLYDMLQSDEAITGLVVTVAQALSRAPASRRRWPRRVEAGAFGWTARRAALRIAAHERRRPDQALSPAAARGLREYMEGPLLRQIEHEAGSGPHDVGFVFGHTHKPFEQMWSGPAFPGPVEMFNTGGWVVDSDVPEPHQGAAVVMLDESLEIASLRCYNQSSRREDYRVALSSLTAPGRRPFHDHLAGIVDPAAAPWSDLARSCAELVTERHRVLDQVIAEARALDR